FFGMVRRTAVTPQRRASSSALCAAATRGYGLDARRRTIRKRCFNFSVNLDWNLFQEPVELSGGLQ
ncbi:MAG TPA: hypothetical protein VGL97_02400, partial [Bryobacteraceae bacterium]